MRSLFNCDDLNRFKIILRDFLITVKEFAAEDNTDLFDDDNTTGKSSIANVGISEAKAAIPAAINTSHTGNIGM